MKVSAPFSSLMTNSTSRKSEKRFVAVNASSGSNLQVVLAINFTGNNADDNYFNLVGVWPGMGDILILMRWPSQMANIYLPHQKAHGGNLFCQRDHQSGIVEMRLVCSRATLPCKWVLPACRLSIFPMSSLTQCSLDSQSSWNRRLKCMMTGDINSNELCILLTILVKLYIPWWLPDPMLDELYPQCWSTCWTERTSHHIARTFCSHQVLLLPTEKCGHYQSFFSVTIVSLILLYFFSVNLL